MPTDAYGNELPEGFDVGDETPSSISERLTPKAGQEPLPPTTSLPAEFLARLWREIKGGLTDIPGGIEDLIRGPGVLPRVLGPLRTLGSPFRIATAPATAGVEMAGRGLSDLEQAPGISEFEKGIGLEPGAVGRGVTDLAPIISGITTGGAVVGVGARLGSKLLTGRLNKLIPGLATATGASRQQLLRDFYRTQSPLTGKLFGGREKAWEQLASEHITPRGAVQSTEGGLQSMMQREGEGEITGARKLFDIMREAGRSKDAFMQTFAGKFGNDPGLAKRLKALSKRPLSEQEEFIKYYDVSPAEAKVFRNLNTFTPAEQNLFMQYLERTRPTPTSRTAREAMPAYDRVFAAEHGLNPEFSRGFGRTSIDFEGKTVPFQVRPGRMYPHEYEGEVSAAIRAKKAAQRMATGLPTTAKYGRQFGDPALIRSGGSYARTADNPDFIKDVYRNVMQRVGKEADVLGQLKAFGPEDIRIQDALTDIRRQWGDNIANNIEKSVYRDIAGYGDAKGISQTIRGFEAATKMSLSFVANASQSLITAITVGFRPTAKAIYEVATGKAAGYRPAEELGLMMKQLHADTMREAGAVGKISKAVLWPFEKVEYNVNQRIAARAGEIAMEDLNTLLQRTGRLSETKLRFMRESGIDTRQVIARGSLTHDEIMKGAYGIVDRTQFLMRPSALPWVMQSSPFMRLVFQMKSFAMRAGGSIKREVYNEAKQGNYAPLMRMATTYPLMGAQVREAQAFIRGRKPETEKTLGRTGKTIEDMLMVGGIGIMGDMLISLGRGKESALGTLAGPALGDILEGGTFATDVGQAFWKEFVEKKYGAAGKTKTALGRVGRYATKKIPFAGSRISEWLKSPSEQARTPKY